MGRWVRVADERCWVLRFEGVGWWRLFADGRDVVGLTGVGGVTELERCAGCGSQINMTAGTDGSCRTLKHHLSIY